MHGQTPYENRLSQWTLPLLHIPFDEILLPGKTEAEGFQSTESPLGRTKYTHTFYPAQIQVI